MPYNIEKIQLHPVKSTIGLSIPLIILILLDAAYVFGDIYWISGLGNSAIVAIGFISNIVYASFKVGDGISSAVNILNSNNFGEKQFEKADNVAVHGLFLLSIISIILPLITIPFIDIICEMADIGLYSGLIYDYLLFPFVFIIFMILSNYFSSILCSECDTKRAALLLLVGNLINIILDPILIFDMNLGMMGAGLATAIGHLISFLLFIYLFFIRKDTLTRINFSNFKFDFAIVKEIIKLAIPIVIVGFMLSILGILINFGLHYFATPYAVAAYIILLKMEDIVFAPINGIGKSLSIVFGHLNGAKRFKLMIYTIKRVLIIVTLCSFVIVLFIIIGYPHIIGFLTSDLLVLEEVRNLMMFAVINIVVYSIIIVFCSFFIGIKKTSYLTYFIVLNVVLSLALLGILCFVFDLGVLGLFLSVILGDVFEIVVMIILTRREFEKKINSLN